jgi:ketosteroid isomerase-like protein
MSLTTTEQDVLHLSNDWAAAELRADVRFLAGILADDFVGIGPRGFMLTREQWLAPRASGDLKYASFGWDDVQARVYGSAAVLIGRQTQEGTYQDHDVRGQFRTTLIFTEQGGQWRIVGIHLSPIAGPMVETT